MREYQDRSYKQTVSAGRPSLDEYVVALPEGL